MKVIVIGCTHAGTAAIVNLKALYPDAEVVVYIRNLMKHNLLNRFAPVKCFDGTKQAELVEGLAVISENIFDKFEGNAFSNGELDSFLKANNITEVEKMKYFEKLEKLGAKFV